MFRAVILILIAAACPAGCSQAAPDRDLDTLRRAALYTFNEREVDAYLGWLSESEPVVVDRVRHLARRNIGQPYRIFLLGEGPFELHDPAPLYCLSASDCVTFVEHTWAMALSDDWSGFFRTLQRIRYRDGEIGMLTRNHFTEADWNVNNRWLFEDVTDALVPGAAVPMRVVVDRAAFFAKHGLTPARPREVVETTYVPRDRLCDIVGHLRDGDVVEIVRGTPDAPYVSHMGLVFRAKDGSATILHSTKPVAREEPLAGYVENHADVIGLKFLRWRAGAHVHPD